MHLSLSLSLSLSLCLFHSLSALHINSFELEQRRVDDVRARTRTFMITRIVGHIR